MFKPRARAARAAVLTYRGSAFSPADCYSPSTGLNTNENYSLLSTGIGKEKGAVFQSTSIDFQIDNPLSRKQITPQATKNPYDRYC